MKRNKTNNGNGPEYLVTFRVYVQADGNVAVVFGNQRMEVTADEVCALIYGTLDYAKVFAALHEHVETTTLAIQSENGTVNGHIGTLPVVVD